MKCKFVIDTDMDVPAMPDSEKSKLRWRQVRTPQGQIRMDAYMPAGTEYEHPGAHILCNHGVAVPVDDECKAACIPLTDEQRRKVEQSYRATALGIADPYDRELFFAGVMDGYDIVNGQQVYKPGPNYAKWKADQDAANTKKESDI